MITVDWLVVGAYLAGTLLVGIWFSRRGAKSFADFFVGGRALPWWLAGTSMAATTFSVDTPLYVTGLVARRGIAGNWEWWAFAITHVLMIYLFARLWRRAEIYTDIELTELRYGGRPAALLRGVRAFIFAVPINCIGMGYAMLAMRKVIEALDIAGPLGALPGEPRLWIVFGISVIVLVYAGLAGLWGVVATDFVQFVLALLGALLVVGFALPDVGGIGGLKITLVERGLGDRLDFMPWSDVAQLSMTTFLAYIGIQWWAFRNSDGGGQFIQRFISSKTERDAQKAAWLFNILHYVVRTWPWIVVGLIALILYPGLADPEIGYIELMLDYLPAGLLGLVVASFLAAFMSTVSTQINWGASYVVNDLYLRWAHPEAGDTERVLVGRLASVVIVGLAGVAAFFADDIGTVFRFMIAIGTGPGAVLILRWFWWRVNAWAELAAMLAGMGIALLSYLPTFEGMEFGVRLAVTAFGSAAIWIPAMFLTRPESEETLAEFYRRTRPGGPGWRRQRERTGLEPLQNLGSDVASGIAGIVLLFALLFGVGSAVLADWRNALLALAAAAAASVVLRWLKGVRSDVGLA
ncbi:MAG: Na+:solute symporter [Gemmatimonadetes bacterium]|uniref:Na+:solute symporter n=1 Tax=Candidatus Kutchimonas denitrificans TaxID=3056748 RepID=A0AAE4Z6N9_9BACT|nr:Na+:solute symporter [Gemmatimonadota bacterium]NIR74344.1 Na+:solute symporter [Candidatus Kutchimonas denitrificans]NIS02595.1 Na+:solute symporter [Gemmatimonadota bacterium]NIT68470.1 Na+:solute symporter [Gemmatimonadota bacterium]NIU51947.1 sodium:proline symporter [Gemmatimonadota bacterium]